MDRWPTGRAPPPFLATATGLHEPAPRRLDRDQGLAREALVVRLAHHRQHGWEGSPAHCAHAPPFGLPGTQARFQAWTISCWSEGEGGMEVLRWLEPVSAADRLYQRSTGAG